jgi:hypothetical protein
MEQLILFLLKNWYLVIIALTFIYQVRSRRKRATQGATRPGMPTFGEGPNGARRPMDAKKTRPSNVAPAAGSERSRDEFKQSGLSKSSSPSSVAKQKSSPFTAPAPKSSIMANSPVYAEEILSSRPFPEQPNREQLLQGVVWAEILGPPRSKKPYRR